MTFSCSLIMKYIDTAIERLESRPADYVSNHEPSVLEKLLKIDRQYAIVMAMDMLFAGVDTVTASQKTIFESFLILMLSFPDLSSSHQLFVLLGQESG